MGRRFGRPPRDGNVGRRRLVNVAAIDRGGSARYRVLVAPSSGSGRVKRGEYDAANFWQDPESDEVICLQGAWLKSTGLRKKRGKRVAVRTFHCRASERCPVWALGSGGWRGRRIEISPQRAALAQQAALAQGWKKSLVRGARDGPTGCAFLHPGHAMGPQNAARRPCKIAPAVLKRPQIRRGAVENSPPESGGAA